MCKSKVAIIILNWNGKNDTIECLKSLGQITYSNYEIVVVDNGSTDESVKYVKSIFPHISLIENIKNLGFAAGNNAGIRHALMHHPDFVLVLNNDTVVDTHFLNELVKVAESDPVIGAVQPKLIRQDDPSIVDSYGIRLACNGDVRDDKAGETDNQNVRMPYQVFGACAAAALYKRTVLEATGLFDDDFFLVHNDTDLSWRIRLAGYKICLVPSAVVFHKRGISRRRRLLDMSHIAYISRLDLISVRIRYYPSILLLKYFPFTLLSLIPIVGYYIRNFRSPELEPYKSPYIRFRENMRIRSAIQSNQLLRRVQDSCIKCEPFLAIYALAARNALRYLLARDKESSKSKLS
jgi:GT2 family glycosyltransferase